MILEEKNIHIIIETDFGEIEVRLFDDTPLHRDNFVKLIEEGFYEGQSFHRIVKDFMIQGGEVSSQARKTYDYQIPAEIVFPKYYHKQGALAAARLGDSVNPNRESSATQFYIVTGEKFTDSDLNLMNKQRFEKFKQVVLADLNSQNKEKVKELYRDGEKAKLSELRNSLIVEAGQIAEKGRQSVLINDEQRNIYKTIGGAPYLDGEYTIFGEVLNGMSLINKIQDVQVQENERPKTNVKFNIRIKK